jgi:hypothetical protein
VVVVDLARVEDATLGLTAADDAAPDDGGVDLQGVHGPELRRLVVYPRAVGSGTYKSSSLFSLHDADILRPVLLVMQLAHGHETVILSKILMHILDLAHLNAE